MYLWLDSTRTTQARCTGNTAQVLEPNIRLSRELQEREEAREEWGDDGNEGHDQRIEKLRDQSQLLGHAIAHAEGTYEYQTERMQDMDEDLRRELERENNERWGHHEYQGNDCGNEQGETSDMEFESDSDED